VGELDHRKVGRLAVPVAVSTVILAVVLAVLALPSAAWDEQEPSAGANQRAEPSSSPAHAHPVPAPPGWQPPPLEGAPVQQAHGLGALPSKPGKYPVGPPPGLKAQQVIPPSVDLSAGEPPVGDQGWQSSCVGWATSYYYKTYQEWGEHRWDLNSPFHQFSPSFVYNQINGGVDNGAAIGDALNLIYREGDAPWAVFPYTYDYTLQPTPAQIEAAAPYVARGYGAFFRNDPWWSGFYNNDITALRLWLAGGDTLVISIPVYSYFSCRGSWSCYSSWACTYIYDGPYSGESYVGWHALQVVGYDDTYGYFQVINSWGTDWGCIGYGYLSYDFVRNYASEAWWMLDQLGDPMLDRFKLFLPMVTR